MRNLPPPILLYVLYSLFCKHHILYSSLQFSVLFHTQFCAFVLTHPFSVCSLSVHWDISKCANAPLVRVYTETFSKLFQRENANDIKKLLPPPPTRRGSKLCERQASCFYVLYMLQTTTELKQFESLAPCGWFYRESEIIYFVLFVNVFHTQFNIPLLQYYRYFLLNCLSHVVVVVLTQCLCLSGIPSNLDLIDCD